jgi:hypothetical protein
MRTIGLLGGMSWESSIEYYRFINEYARDRLGGFHSARSLMFSFDFDEIEQLQRAGRWALAGERLRRQLGGSRRRAQTYWCCAPTRCTGSPMRSKRRCRSRSCTSPTRLRRPSGKLG